LSDLYFHEAESPFSSHALPFRPGDVCGRKRDESSQESRNHSSAFCNLNELYDCKMIAKVAYKGRGDYQASRMTRGGSFSA
jgi:hypothetical protein